jgi:predicted 3-demethylubiquinone-9 3-methyltransferase (glyoxalase superfamily)
MPRITPTLWFDTQGKEAADFWVSVFPNSKIVDVSYYGEAGPRRSGTVLTVDFELDGQPYMVLNGGPQFTFDEAVSFTVDCKDQEEVDYYWEALMAGGGEPGQCGWLKDRFGVSWQIVPQELGKLIADPDQGRAQRAMTAMLGQVKLDIAAIRAAADGE